MRSIASGSIRVYPSRKSHYLADYGVPSLAVAGLTAGGLAMEATTLACPYLALVAIVAHRICLQSAVLTILLAIPCNNYFFMESQWAWDHPIARELLLYGLMAVITFLVAPSRRVARRIPDLGGDLPFTSRDTPPTDSLHGEGVRYWDVRPSGVWAEDCAVGMEYARVYVSRFKCGERRPLLCWIIRDMIRGGQWSGVEAGFAQRVSCELLPKRRDPAKPHL